MSLLRQSPAGGGPAHSPSSEQGGGAAADWPASSPASSSSSGRLGVVHSPASPAPGPLSLNSMQIALMALKVRVAPYANSSGQPVFRFIRQYFVTDPDLRIRNPNCGSGRGRPVYCGSGVYLAIFVAIVKWDDSGFGPALV